MITERETTLRGFPGGSDDKESCNAGDGGQSLGQEDPLENRMSTGSNTLVWGFLWTEEPGRLQSTALQRVRHNCSYLALTVLLLRLVTMKTATAGVSELFRRRGAKFFIFTLILTIVSR